MTEEQIKKVVDYLEQRKDNQKAEAMLIFLKQDRNIGEKVAFIQKNINQVILRKIIY